jgi:branched-chain amino acid transport system substrate-binding protein
MLLAYARLVKPRHVGILQLRHVAYDSQVRDVLVPGLKEAGAASVTVETFDGSDLPAVRSIAAKFKSAKPDLLIVCAYYNQLPQVLKFVTEQGVLENSELLVGINLPVATRLGLISSNTLDRVTLAAPEYTLRGEAGQEPSERAKGFRERYRKRFGKEPDYDAAYGYDALMLLADAIKVVGVDPIQVAAHLKSVEGYPGVSGQLSIGADGNSSTRWLLGGYDKGTLSLIEAAR